MCPSAAPTSQERGADIRLEVRWLAGIIREQRVFSIALGYPDGNDSARVRQGPAMELDPSVDPTHGQQPLSFFNGHYDTWCYQFGFLSVDDSPEQRLFHARLRPRALEDGLPLFWHE